MTLLSAHDLAVARAGVPVLQGVNFVLVPGRALVLRGPNGIGKTTLLRTVAGSGPTPKGTITANSRKNASPRPKPPPARMASRRSRIRRAIM